MIHYFDDIDWYCTTHEKEEDLDGIWEQVAAIRRGYVSF